MEQVYTTNTPIPDDPTVCRSCGNTVNGKYCVTCGEKSFEPGEHSVKHFMGDVLNALTFLDSKFLRTIKLMFRNPGVVSYQYMNGRRMPFIKPMSMFFIANLIYFMFPMYNSLDSPLDTQMNNLPHSFIAERIVKERIKEEKISLSNFTIKYQTQSTNMAKMLLVMMVLYFSIPLAVVNYNKKVYYFDHLLVALELCSLIVLVVFVLFGWLFYWAASLTELFGGNIWFIMQDEFSSWVSAVVILYLLYKFERNAYSQNIFRSLTKAGLLLFFFVVVLMLYRASLFFVTMWTV